MELSGGHSLDGNLLEGNSPDGNSPGGNLKGQEFSRWEFIRWEFTESGGRGGGGFGIYLGETFRKPSLTKFVLCFKKRFCYYTRLYQNVSFAAE